jgi:vang-like
MELPHLNLTEDVVDEKSNKFVIRLNSETSV